LAKRFTEKFGVPLLNGLGATEALHIVVCGDEREPADSLGHAVPGVTATVRDEAGHVVPDGQVGRLHIRGPSVALGYLDRPADSARTFRDGGAYTGDVVRRCGDALQYLCRADDLLNLGGFKVSPFEIEGVVRGAEGVADCAVVAETDDVGLQRAVVYAVGDATLDAPALRAAIASTVRAGLAPFKRPSRIEVLDRLPVTSNGKLARTRLRSLGSHDGL
jgi:acyl-coenzyme A synthetase/AMP-(fatty) acid ligase